MRPLVLVLALLAVSASVLAQDTNESLAENGSAPSNETPPASEEPTSPPAEEPAAAGPAGPIVIVLEGVQEENEYFFRDASGAKNPPITVQPGQEVTLKFTSVSGVHNVNLGGLGKTALISDGESTELIWTAPTDAKKIEYWCDPHKSAGMKGTLNIGEATPPVAHGEDGAITGETVDLGQFDPACAGKVAPAIVTTDATGGATLPDYIAKCKTVSSDTTARAAHAVDAVIPISWALIGLGIVGVVWVHKYYKP